MQIPVHVFRIFFTCNALECIGHSWCVDPPDYGKHLSESHATQRDEGFQLICSQLWILSVHIDKELEESG